MQVLTSEQIRQWDAFTIKEQNISSLDLMERAVTRCKEWLAKNNYLQRSFVIFSGSGNNGADGLVLARMLHSRQCDFSVFILDSGNEGSADFLANLQRLQQTGVAIHFIRSPLQFLPVPENAVIMDALFGSGLNRPPDELTAGLIEHINSSGNEIISIDIPSGMFSNKTSKGSSVVKAMHTLTFQVNKLAFLLPENEASCGEVHILDIGLSPDFLKTVKPDMELVDKQMIRSIYKARKSFSHKGTFGHAMMVAGSYGKIGAAVLTSKACLHTGVGLLTCHIPACGYEIMQIAVPEAMVVADQEKNQITGIRSDKTKFSALGIGPGLGTDPSTTHALEELLTDLHYPVVLDADALNIISENRYLFEKVPPLSILTPHPKEFERLFGKTNNDFEMLDLALEKSKQLQVIIVLKGHHTFIAMPDGKSYFNSTGNAGMATGGSGDVLTGIITSLLAQKYEPGDAAVFGVYLHGMAGDFAAEQRSQEAMTASDIIHSLGDAFRKIASVQAGDQGSGA